MSIMKALALISLSLILAGVGCATHHGELVLERVGPAQAHQTQAESAGTLMVYSALDQSPHFNGSDYHAWYSPYEVMSEDGQIVKKVANDTSTVVQGPAEVKLAPGKYRVKARANGYGLVIVPVLIEPERLTTVHLEGGDKWKGDEAIAKSNAVRLPGGGIVGWRAPTNLPATEPQHIATGQQ